MPCGGLWRLFCRKFLSPLHRTPPPTLSMLWQFWHVICMWREKITEKRSKPIGGGVSQHALLPRSENIPGTLEMCIACQIDYVQVNRARLSHSGPSSMSSHSICRPAQSLPFEQCPEALDLAHLCRSCCLHKTHVHHSAKVSHLEVLLHL